VKTWVYPTNLGAIRNYQYSIVKHGLFNNLLVALPTGLGKTFIAATIMLNFFRWTKDAKIVFVAPTKPLVAQQVDACFNIVGIPKSQTTMLTGEQVPTLRAEEWREKRVFFMTPQTLENDLASGNADPKTIVLLVVDEAHRATGNYSYVKVVNFMRRFNKSFRILALTATPGASVEAVQEVIDGLEISKVEIRTEESIDIQQYVHRRDIDQILLDPSDEMIMVKDLFSKALQPLVNQLCGQNAYWNKDPMALTPFGMMQARKNWFKSEAARRASQGLKGMMHGLFSILASVAHSIKLLNFHGIGPFFSSIKDFRQGVDDKNKTVKIQESNR
jgi:ATP-dependent DNA helicase MPH1